MKLYLKDIGLDAWVFVVDGKNNDYNTEFMKKILNGLSK